MPYKINPRLIHTKPLIDNIESYFEQSTHTLYDKRNVIRVVNFEGDNYVVKAFKVPNFINRFAYRYLRPSKAKRSFQYSLKLGSELTPAPVAYIENISSFVLSKSYYISSFFNYDYTIHEVLKNKQLANREAILKGFANFTFQLHEQEILHHDYSHGNILIKVTPTGNEFKIIDINRMAFRAMDIQTRLENFAKIKADDEDMEIIITHYLQRMKLPVGNLLKEAKSYRDAFYRKRGLKNKVRGYFK
jgi:hypothetical protein